MYLMYVDESGDPGVVNSPTRHFALSGLVVHESDWRDVLDRTIALRRQLRAKYSIKLREEVHAAEFVHRGGPVAHIPKWQRLMILRDCLRFQSQLTGRVSILNVVVDKTHRSSPTDVFEWAWMLCIQRFENTISHGNFPGGHREKGLIIVDRTDQGRLRKLLRKMRRYNPVPSMHSTSSRSLALQSIVEDAVHRDSHHSLFIQLADVNAYFLRQKVKPCSFVKKRGARNYFDTLDPVLCKQASRTDPQGIVWQ